MTERKPALWRRILLKDGRLRGTFRLLLYFPVTLLIALLISIPIASGATALGFPYGLVNALAYLGAIVGMLLSTWAFCRLLDRRSFASLGFRLDHLALGDMAWGVFMGAALFLGVFGVELAAGWLTVTAFYWETAAAGAIVVSLAFSVIQCIGVGVMEETISRGYMLQSLADDWGVAAAVIISSVVFGLLHAGNDNVTPLALFNLCVIGALFAYGYLVTRQLWLPIALHFSWNFCQGPVFGLPVSGSGRGDLWTTQVSGPDWITGGAFGPEGGVLVLAGVAVLWGLTWVWGRLRRRLANSRGPAADARA